MGTLCIPKLKRGTCLLPAARPPSATLISSLAPEDQVLLTRLLAEPSDFMDHPEFCKRGMEVKLFGAKSKLRSRMATRFAEMPDPVTDAVRSGERVPALSGEQEQHLFKRFNFARRETARLLAECSGKNLTAASTRLLLAWGQRVLIIFIKRIFPAYNIKNCMMYLMNDCFSLFNICIRIREI